MNKLLFLSNISTLATQSIMVNLTPSIGTTTTTTTTISPPLTTTILPDDCFDPHAQSPATIVLMGRTLLYILYTCTSLAAFTGNLTVIVVEVKGSESARNIRRYLINLALSDIVFGVLCVPFTYTGLLLGRWVFPHWLCPVSQFVQFLSVFVTATTLAVIGVERYMAILHPFSNLHRWLESNTHLMLIGTWAVGTLYAALLTNDTHTSPLPSGTPMSQNESMNTIDLMEVAIEQQYECRYSNSMGFAQRRLKSTSNLFFTFVLPMGILLWSYLAIMSKLMRDQKERSTDSSTDSPNKKQSPEPSRQPSADSDNVFLPRPSFPALSHRKKTIKMMFLVILLFAVCWLPIKVFQFCLDFGFVPYCSELSYYVLMCLYFTSHWCAMASSFVNPIVYSFMSKSFRKDFHKLAKTIRRDSHQTSLKTISTQV